MGHIKSHVEDALGWITIDRPERRNAMNQVMWSDLCRCVQALAADPSIRVILLRGAGDEAFVSGADIGEFGELRVGDRATQYQRSVEAALAAIEAAPQPVVSLVQGWCIGAGAAIALRTDLRYGADDVVFAIPAARLGLGYGVDDTKALIDAVGAANAREVLYTGQRYSAADAQRLGVFHRVFPTADIEREVGRIAGQLARNAPLTIQSAKVTIQELGRPTPDAKRMAAGIRRCFASEDYAEGIRAFMGKRAAVFNGR